MAFLSRSKTARSSPAYELTPGANRKLASRHSRNNFPISVEVFWKDFRGIRVAEPLEGGVGPVLSVFAHDHEVLRFDCLGERGHFHAVFARIEPTTYNRLRFYETSQDEQVERSIFEITTNLAYYLDRNPEPQVRSSTSYDENTLGEVCASSRSAALHLLESQL